MKTPKYWQANSLIAAMLSPLGFIYGRLTQWRLRLHKAPKAEVPVICVGNITVGGTGKTPVSLSIAKILETEMYHPFFVTRGYGGKMKNVLVNCKKHSASEVGDEPLLLAKQAPTVVNPNRYAAAQLAIQQGADIIIMDDGFQNPSLYKDLSFIVFDGNYGVGNGRLLPAGPLRETLSDGLKRADALIILGKDKHNLAAKTNLPVFYGNTEPAPTTVKKTDILAFAGIGNPQKFYRTLQQQGFNVLKTIDFPDHHFYSNKEISDLIAIAQKDNLEIYTTSKDYVKIPQHYKNEINVLEIAVVWNNPEQLTEFIKQKLELKK